MSLQYLWFAKIITASLVAKDIDLKNSYVPSHNFKGMDMDKSYVKGILYK